MPASDKFPRVRDVVPLKPRSDSAPTSKEGKKLYERLAAIVGFSTKDGLGNTYSVITLAGAVAIKRTAVDGAMSTVMPNTPDWTRAAILLLNAHKNSGKVAGKPKSMFKPSTRSGSSSGSGSSASASASSASAPAWASQPYVAEIAALVGFTGPSATTPGIAYAVKMVDIGGVAAPAIDVASGGGVTGSTGATSTITPEGATWVASALEVFAAKSAKDAGVTLPTGGAPGTMTVTSALTGSEGSVFPMESVPSSDVLADQAQQTVDAALSEGGMAVSSGNFDAAGASALAKYKWFIVAGVGFAGFYYARRAGWLK
jgi:hypothetical protein